MDRETVLCVDKQNLVDVGLIVPHSDGNVLGISEVSNASLKLSALNFKFVERQHCETDETLKQIIPYVMVSVKERGAGKAPMYLRYSRKGSEERLHGLFSLGVGGHIHPSDAGAMPRADLLSHASSAAYREVLEELGALRALTNQSFRLRGLVNDDETPVGRVHLGLVYTLDIEIEPAEWFQPGVAWNHPGLRTQLYPAGCENFGDGELLDACLLDVLGLDEAPAESYERWSFVLIPLC